jgi:hypothetical protein
MKFLKTDAMGKHEIVDGDSEAAVEALKVLDRGDGKEDPEGYIWSGPYRPGGADAVDAIDPTYPEDLFNRAMKRLQSFSEKDKAKRKAWQASQRPSFEQPSSSGSSRRQYLHTDATGKHEIIDGADVNIGLTRRHGSKGQMEQAAYEKRHPAPSGSHWGWNDGYRVIIKNR